MCVCVCLSVCTTVSLPLWTDENHQHSFHTHTHTQTRTHLSNREARAMLRTFKEKDPLGLAHAVLSKQSYLLIKNFVRGVNLTEVKERHLVRILGKVRPPLSTACATWFHHKRLFHFPSHLLKLHSLKHAWCDLPPLPSFAFLCFPLLSFTWGAAWCL